MKVFALKNYNSPLSSSGVAFPAIADAYWNMIDSKELFVYGAAFVEGFDVQHIRVNYQNGIQALLESKYAQSNMSGVYNSLFDDLSNGRHVIFAGTPCQVQAVNRYIEQKNLDRRTLLTIDLVCHGTPPNKFWNEYVNLIHKHTKDKIEEIHFRYRQLDSGEKSGLAYIMSDGSIRYSPKDLKVYMRMFSRNLSLNKACFMCPHRNDDLIRPGDFTIGDFWGVSEIIDDFKNINGVSLVLTNTAKAEQLIKTMKSDLSGKLILKECISNNWLDFNPHVNIQTKKPNQYETFWNDYKTMDFAALIEKWKKESVNSRIKVCLSHVADCLGIKWKLKRLLNHKN